MDKHSFTDHEAMALWLTLYGKRVRQLLPDMGSPINHSKVAAELFKLIGLPPSEFKSLNVNEVIPFLDQAIEATKQKGEKPPDPPNSSPSGADNSKEIPPKIPDSPDVSALCKLLAKRPPGVSLNEVARTFTRESKHHFPKAKNLLRQAQRFRHLWTADD